MKTNETNIIKFPEYDSLKRDVEKLRTEISMLVLARDHLRFVECKNLETSYMLTLGALEHKAYEAQCMALRLKRKIEIIQAKKNRQEKILLAQIEQTLDDEFAAYQEKLNEQIEKMNEAIKHSKCDVLTDEEAKEVKKLYREIVKKLHPDLHPDLTKAQRELFQNAVEAYRNGDIATLRLIHTMSGDLTLPEGHKDAVTVLRREKERLEKIIALLNDEISAIKSEFPYTVKEFLEDEAKVTEKKREIELIISRYQEMIRLYQERIDEMLR